MKYTDLEKKVASVESNRYETRLDRVKDKMNKYIHKDLVHIFDKKGKRDVAKIAGEYNEVIFKELGLPVQLDELITSYAKTPLEKRETDRVKDDSKNHNILL